MNETISEKLNFLKNNLQFLMEDDSQHICKSADIEVFPNDISITIFEDNRPARYFTYGDSYSNLSKEEKQKNLEKLLDELSITFGSR